MQPLYYRALIERLLITPLSIEDWMPRKGYWMADPKERP